MKPDSDLPPSEVNRREFIWNATSVGALMTLMGGVPIRAEDKLATTEAGVTNYSTVSAPISFGVVGCGPWGREVLQTLARLPNAPVVAVCDDNASALRRAQEAAPKAEAFSDYHKLLEKKEVQGVVVATPSHLHKDIVLAALAAGKHVYCEAPLASSAEDARAIAQAAKAAVKLNFQTGLQMRSHPQRHFLLPFIRSGATGKSVMARAQWHKKDSWRRAAGTPEREKAINWRLSKATSSGLLGEIGIHQLDTIAWLLNSRPTAVSGFGGIMKWDDGRDVADTVQATLEFPDGVNLNYDCTLANSFDSDYEILYGVDAAVMLRGSKAWLFKEVDSPLLGWEVYARKDQFYQETGIALVMDASKRKADAKSAEAPAEDTPLQLALTAFVTNSGLVTTGVQDFVANFGEDTAALRDYLGTLSKSRRAAAGYQEGFEATMTAIKANEAVVAKQRIEMRKEWFEI